MANRNQRPSLSGLAIAAAVCSIATLQLLAADVVLHLDGAARLLWGSGSGWWSSALILAPGALGIAAAVRIALSRGKVTGLGFALLGIVTTLLGLVAAVYAWAGAMSMLAWGTS
jgi:hypothetical protein